MKAGVNIFAVYREGNAYDLSRGSFFRLIRYCKVRTRKKVDLFYCRFKDTPSKVPPYRVWITAKLNKGFICMVVLSYDLFGLDVVNIDESRTDL